MASLTAVRRAERNTIASTLALAAAAWIALAVAGRTALAGRLHHPALGASSSELDPSLFLLGWLLMVAAMMLPASLRFLTTIHRLVQARHNRKRLIAVALGAYALPWVIVGQLFQVGDVGVHWLVARWGWLAGRPWLVTAGALVLAGGYQFSPLNLRCLRECRNPAGFVARGWHGQSPRRELLQIGAAYGWSCVGCCWALMLLMFAAGVSSLGLMALLTVTMVAERRLPYVERAVGALLVVAGALVALQVLPPLAT